MNEKENEMSLIRRTHTFDIFKLNFVVYFILDSSAGVLKVMNVWWLIHSCAVVIVGAKYTLKQIEIVLNINEFIHHSPDIAALSICTPHSN